jgi:hypothetical protein
MANLIDESFFIGEINIPNTGKPEIKESLDVFINKYEKELMQRLLGIQLWKIYDIDSTSLRFTDLINGVDYTTGSYYYSWRGLVWGTAPNKHSLIANYIYWHWIKDKEIWNSGIGTIRATPNQAISISPGLKMSTTWNQFSYQVAEFNHYMSSSLSVYPEWQPFNLWEFRTVNDFDI